MLPADPGGSFNRFFQPLVEQVLAAEDEFFIGATKNRPLLKVWREGTRRRKGLLA